VLLSVVAHVAIAALLVIAPLMAADVLPAPRIVIGAFTAHAQLPDPPAPPAARRAGLAAAEPAPSTSAAPREAPATIAGETDTTAHLPGSSGGVDGGLSGAIGRAGPVPDIPAPPPPPAPQTTPVPVGGRIKEPAKVRHVPPVYPVIAQQARVEGVVIIEAVIGTDGRVSKARILRSQLLLDDAALTAVRQWVFTPTLLNGAPVPVLMTVTVHFRLH
jgi:protein TonB